MANSTEVVIPELGLGVDSAIVSQWCVADGAEVSAEEPVCELETDKVTTEVVSPASGTLHHRVALGAEVEVDQVIAIVTSSA